MNVSGSRAFASALGIIVLAVVSALLSMLILYRLLRLEDGLGLIIGSCCTFIGTAFGFYLINKRVRPSSNAQSVLTVLYTWVIISILLVWAFPMTSTSHFFTLGDAYIELFWTGILLCIIFLASFTGRLFAGN